MSSDTPRRKRLRARPVEPPKVPDGPLKDLKAAVYELYLLAETPTLDEIESEVAALAEVMSELLRRGGTDEDTTETYLDALEGAAPRRDTIGRIIGAPVLPPNQADVVAVVAALARMAGRLPSYTIRNDLPALIAQVQLLWRKARIAPPETRLGRPIGRCSPLALEVHRAIDMPGQGTTLSALPRYVPRAHDAKLRNLVAACGRGDSKMITLVGDSSTGKTRACWEAVQELPDEWRLWHPIDPARPAAAANQIADVGPHTVVWLNEAQFYLLSADLALSERISAGLRTLLDDPDRGPVLILATMWPQYWAALTTVPPPGEPDRHAQARELLAGTDLQVPDAFKAVDLRSLRTAAKTDARLSHAAAHADGGRVTQYLAGAPELLQRARNAPAPARAVINAAIDTRRFGHPPALSGALLKAASAGYLHDVDSRQAGDNWLDQAFSYALRPCHGVPGPLAVVRPGPSEFFRLFEPASYRLADYLDQTGKAERADVFPPASFWDAVAETVRDPDVLRTIGSQAERRGRYHRAAQLYRRSTEFGDVHALEALARLFHQAGDLEKAEALYHRAADRGSADALENQAWIRQLRGHSGDDDAFFLATQRRIMEIRATNEYYESLFTETAERKAMVDLLARASRLRDSGELSAARKLYEDAARRGETSAIAELATLSETVGDHHAAAAFAIQAVRAGRSEALLGLTRAREQRGDHSGAETLARKAGEQGEPGALYLLTRMRAARGEDDGPKSVLTCAVDQGYIHVFSILAEERARAGRIGESWELWHKAAELGDVGAIELFALRREEEGEHAAAEELAVRAAERGDTRVLLRLAARREERHDLDGAESLYRDGAARGETKALRALARIYDLHGDYSAAEDLLLAAINRGNDGALSDLAGLREQMGDRLGADRVRRFGLDDAGSPATSLE